MTEIEITGWHPGFKKISFAKLLQACCEISIFDAKITVDKVLRGDAVLLKIKENDVDFFMVRAKECGVAYELVCNKR